MRFRIHQPSYIGDTLVDQLSIDPNPTTGKHHTGHDMELKPLALKGERITQKPMGGKPKTIRLDADLWPIPAPHWEPLDEDAKKLCEKHHVEFTGEMADVLTGLEEELSDAQNRQQRAQAEMIAQAVAIGVSQALKETGVSRK